MYRMTTDALLVVVVVMLVVAIAAPGTYWLYVAFAAMRSQMAEMREAQGDFRAELARVEAELAMSQERIRQLERAFREATGQEPPAAVSSPVASGRVSHSPAALARRIEALFSSNEIDGLAYDLEIAGAVVGDTTEERARSLVEAARRRGKLRALIQTVRRERPTGGF